MVRYYLESGNNQSGANDILLTSLSKQLNAENFVEKDSFFQDFVTKANTNITVRDYAAADDKSLFYAIRKTVSAFTVQK